MTDSPIHNITHKTDPEYPALLREIPAFPCPLYYRGTLPPHESLMIAVVGTRKASPEGKHIAKEFAYTLARKGAYIVSGLALGIDAAAHEGALAAHAPTAAVLANGLHMTYPAQHESLATQILSSRGCLFSEYEEGTPPLPHHFLERNRIVSGLSHATLVIEAPLKSGALVTARNAIEQGREVFVVPGSSRHPNYRGSHMLLREGARLVTSPEDLLLDLAPIFQNFSLPSSVSSQSQNLELSEEERLVFETLANAKQPLPIDTIIEFTTLEPRIVHHALASLTLENRVHEHHGAFSIITNTV